MQNTKCVDNKMIIKLDHVCFCATENQCKTENEGRSVTPLIKSCGSVLCALTLLASSNINVALYNWGTVQIFTICKP